MVAVSAGAGMMLSSVPAYSSGLFLEPVTHELGWTRAEMSQATLIGSIAGILLGPLMGGVIDRIGPRKIGIAACFALCIGMGSFSLTTSNIWVWRGLALIYAASVVMFQPLVWTSAVTASFSKGRGLALALTLSGGGVSSMIVPPVAYWTIENYGWRAAYVMLPAMAAAIVVPLLYFFFKSPNDRVKGAARGDGPRPRASAREVFRTHVFTFRFARLAIAGYAFALCAVSMAVNIVPVLSDYGLPRAEAAGIASLIGFTAIAGRLSIGLLLDRFPARSVAAGAACLPMIGVGLLLAGHGSATMAAAAVLIFGLSLGAELDTLAYLTSRYFPTRNYGLLFGVIGGAVGLAGSTGPLMLNAVFDYSGHYGAALWAVLPVSIVASLLLLSLGAAPPRESGAH